MARLFPRGTNGSGPRRPGDQTQAWVVHLIFTETLQGFNILTGFYSKSQEIPEYQNKSLWCSNSVKNMHHQ